MMSMAFIELCSSLPNDPVPIGSQTSLDENWTIEVESVHSGNPSFDEDWDLRVGKVIERRLPFNNTPLRIIQVTILASYNGIGNSMFDADRFVLISRSGNIYDVDSISFLPSSGLVSSYGTIQVIISWKVDRSDVSGLAMYDNIKGITFDLYPQETNGEASMNETS